MIGFSEVAPPQMMPERPERDETLLALSKKLERLDGALAAYVAGPVTRYGWRDGKGDREGSVTVTIPPLRRPDAFRQLAGQLQRLGAHIADAADALGVTAARIRDAMTGQRC